MKLLILAVVLAVATAAPRKRDVLEVKPIAILRSASEFNDDGSYTFNFESEDGVKVEQAGSQKLIASADPAEEPSVGTVMRGSYSYEHEGVTYTVNWVADENGFQPSGAHLPVAPVA